MLEAGMHQKKQKTQALLEKYSYDVEELLAKERLGVYLFRWNPPVESVPVTETGFDIATLDEVSERLNQISQEVYFQLLDG
jgi:hypothetical protein